jgi:flagellar biosynthetic protein FliQ
MNPADIDTRVLELAQQMLVTVLMISGPILATGLIVGLSVSLFQALTSVQEQTLSLVPKMLAVLGMSLLVLTPALVLLRSYTSELFGQLITFGTS